MKKFLALTMAMLMSVAALTGCGGGSETNTEEGGDTATTMSGTISVVSREDGSGTRGAFIELFGIEQDGVDMTTPSAEITNSTAVMMTTIAGNPSAIGYVSLGSLNDTVKALKIDGAEATADNIKDGTYKVARPFNIATTAEVSDVAKDFIAFIMSDAGQAVVEEEGYISQGNTGAYAATGITGKVSIAGSSSITPVMEKLKEAYVALNPDVTIEIQQNDSTTGMTSVTEGGCDIGMASRALKDSELANGLQPTVIAMDGIAIVVNQENGITDMTSDTVKSIFMGETTDWSEVVA